MCVCERERERERERECAPDLNHLNDEIRLSDYLSCDYGLSGNAAAAQSHVCMKKGNVS